MPVVVSVLVGGVLVVWAGLFLWSTLRAARMSRLRAPRRATSAAPEGLDLGMREPAAMSAPFAFVLRGSILDVAESFVGEFRGATVGITDVTARVSRGAQPSHHTVGTLDVDWRWPWMRIRRVGVAAPEVDQPVVNLVGIAGAGDWVVEAANPELADDLVTAELLAWLSRGDLPLQVETTPRHLLVAVDGHLADDRLEELLTLLTGIPDHVPQAVRAAVTPPAPEDDL